jgi:hypothetical protein
VDLFVYSPAVAACFVPWSGLPDSLGGLLWRLASVAFFALALGRFVKTLGAGPERLTPAWLWLLMLPLVGGSIHNGQVNILLLALFLTALTAAHKRRWWPAAICLAAATLLKVYPLLLAFFMVLKHRPLLWRLGVVLTIGVLLPFALQDPVYVWEQYQGWIERLAGQDRTHWPIERWPRDLFLLVRLGGDPWPGWLYQLVRVGFLGLATGLLWRCGRRRVSPAAGEAIRTRHVSFQDDGYFSQAALGLACAAMLVLGPAGESSTYCLLAPALLLALTNSVRASHGGSARVLWIAYGLLAVSALACWFSGGAQVAGILQPLAGFAFLLERLGWTYGLPAAAPPTEPRRILQTRVVLPKETVACAVKA